MAYECLVFSSFESSEGGDLWFGGSFGSFGGFDHSWFVLWLNLLLFKCFKPKNLYLLPLEWKKKVFT